uniref:Ubs_08 putative toxin n=1 Tax=Unedogemmula bisaya TaxID=746885 RepID=A0A098LY03_UNEBI
MMAKQMITLLVLLLLSLQQGTDGRSVHWLKKKKASRSFADFLKTGDDDTNTLFCPDVICARYEDCDLFCSLCDMSIPLNWRCSM